VQNSKKIHVWPEEITEKEGHVSAGFTLEFPQRDRFLAWYRLPGDFSHHITKGCDPFVLGALFTAMRKSANMVVHGEVSPILLRNLEEFQAVFSLWYPQLYTRIEILADIEKEQDLPKSTAAISTFSGGVDSCFTAWHHRKGKNGRNNQDLRAGLVLHGFDIPKGRIATFERVTNKARILLNSLDMEMIPMTFNLKKLGDNFAHSQAAFLASCMSLLQGGYVVGLIPSSRSYANLRIPYGTTPVTDSLLSSGSFSIIHDASGFTRSEKIYEIADWPEALQYLRVCLGENRSERDKNCGRCEKCVRTILEFRSLGLDLPLCFKQDVSNNQIIKLGYDGKGFTNYYKEIVENAKESKVSGSWVTAVRLSILINQVRQVIINSPMIRGLYKKYNKGIKEPNTYWRIRPW